MTKEQRRECYIVVAIMGCIEILTILTCIPMICTFATKWVEYHPDSIIGYAQICIGLVVIMALTLMAVTAGVMYECYKNVTQESNTSN